MERLSTVLNISTTSQSEDYDNGGIPPHNTSNINTGKTLYSRLEFYVDILSLVTCCTGFMGNGAVIWVLGFHIKRKPFTTYVLNLAVADLGVLTTLASRYVLLHTGNSYFPLFACLYLFLFMFTTSQFLLTGISIDRCVSVLFPMWHRCLRPTNFSSVVCGLIWFFSFLLSAIILILDVTKLFGYDPILVYHFLLTALFCLPLMTVSTVTLFIKVCFKSHQRQRGKILIIILLTLLFFCMLDFPFSALLLINFFFKRVTYNLFQYGYLCVSLNSSVNPLIYFVVGRKKRGRSKKNMEGLEQQRRLRTENGRRTLLIDTHI